MYVQQDDETVLMRATKTGNFELVRLLVEQGADVKAKSKVCVILSFCS